MATRREPPETRLALLDSVLADGARTRRALALMLGGAVAFTVALAPVLVCLLLFGVAGTVAVGGTGTILTAGLALIRRHRSRR